MINGKDDIDTEYEDSLEHNEGQMQFMANRANEAKELASKHLADGAYALASHFYKQASLLFADAALYAAKVEDIKDGQV